MKRIGFVLFWCCCCIFVRGEKDKEMWCRYGTILRGGDECLCTREGEDSCVGSGCGSGYGTSFYPKSCTSCKCLDPRGSGDIYTEKDKKPRGRSDASSAANADSRGRPSPSSGKNYQPRKPPSNRRASSVDSENADTREDLENYFAWRDHMKETPSMTDEDFNKIIVFAASIVVASILSIGVCCMGKASKSDTRTTTKSPSSKAKINASATSGLSDPKEKDKKKTKALSPEATPNKDNPREAGADSSKGRKKKASKRRGTPKVE